MTPEQLAAQESDKRLRSAFLDNDFGDASAMLGDYPIENKEGFLRGSAVAGWVSQAMGQRVNPASPEWQGIKDGLMKGYFKQPNAQNVTDDEAFNFIAADYKTRDAAVSAAFTAAATNKLPTEIFAEFDKGAETSLVKSRWYKYQAAVQDGYTKLSDRLGPYRDIIDQSASVLGKELETGLPTTDAFKGIADTLLSIPERDRRLVIKAIGAVGGETPDAQRSYLGKLGAAIGRETEAIGASVESGIVDLALTMAASGGIKDVNADAGVAMEQQASTSRDRYLLANMIRTTADSEISPLEVEGFVAETGLSLARMAPMVAASTIPYAGVAALGSYYRDETAANLMLEYDGMTRQQADNIANVAFAPIAAAEHISNKIPLGKLPYLGAFLKSSITSMKSGLLRGAGFVAGGVATEIAEEAFQQEFPKVVQQMFAAVSEDYPDVNWKEEKRKLAELPAQVVGPAFVVSLIGGGVSSIREVKNGRAIASDRDLLIASGYAPSVADDIRASADKADWQGVDTLMRKSFNTSKGGIEGATPEERQAAVKSWQNKLAMTAEATQRMELDGTLASLRNTGTGWQVLRPDGSAPVNYQSFEDANAARWADAKQRSLRVHAAMRDVITKADRALKAGQENLIKFDPALMTPDLAVDRGYATREQIDKRIAQAEAQDEGKLENDIHAQAMTEAQADGDTAPVYAIWGRTWQEANGRAVIQLFQGATPQDLIEEISEVGLKRHFAAGANKAELVSQLRTTETQLQELEKAAGLPPSLLFRTKNDAELTDSDVIEAFSHIAKAYYSNEPSIKDERGIKNYRAYVQYLRKAVANSPIFSWIKALGKRLGSIMQRAALIEELRKDKKFDGNLEKLIRQSLGLETQDAFENGVVEEAQAIANSITDPSVDSRAQPTGEMPATIMPDGTKMVGPGTFSITAYHGTPHKVDRFSLDKIGTGEGAQAYGWGLYFAESPDVAGGYQRKLSGGRSAAQKIYSLYQDDLHESLIESIPLGIEDEASDIMARLERAGDAFNVYLEVEKYGSPEALAWLNKAAGISDNEGNFYTVDLLPDEADFLDWDKPLSEQSEKVKKALEGYNITEESLEDQDYLDYFPDGTLIPGVEQLSGAALYRIVGMFDRGMVDLDNEEVERTPRADSQALLKIGIPGIRYLDGPSRAAGTGTYNYVIFDEALVKILEENGKPVDDVLRGTEPSFSLTVYRAGDASETGVKPFASFTEDQETAKAYQDNPGFGGPVMRSETVQGPLNIHTMGAPTRANFRKLAEAIGMEADEGDAWFDNGWQYPWEESSKVKRALEDSDIDAVRYTDDFPAGASTIIFTRDPAERGDASFSVSASKKGTLEERLTAMFNVFQRSPELRRKLGLAAKDRVAKVAREYLAATETPGMTARMMEKMEKDRLKALSKVTTKTPDWVKKNLEKPTTEVQAKAQIAEDRLLGWLRTLNAVVSTLPKEIQGKIIAGGSIKIAGLKTNEARLRAVQDIVSRADKALEKWLRKEITAQVEKTFKRYAPDRVAGQKPKGKLDPDAQELVDSAEDVMNMDSTATLAEIAKVEALLADPDITPEQEVLLDRKRSLLELFGDWKNADAARMDSALQALQATASEGWAKWKIQQLQKREEREEIRKQLRTDTGKKGTGIERDKMKVAGAQFVGKSVAKLLNISSFTEVLRFAFGSKSAEATRLIDGERNASNEYEDAVQDLADRVEDFFTGIAGGVLRGEQMRFDMSRPKITVGKGTPNERFLSELQGIQALMMWQQEDGRRHMEGPRDESGNPLPDKWSYSQEWIDELTSKLPPRAAKVKTFLEEVYSEEYAPLNALYRSRHGVNLPKHALYSPITVAPQQAKAGEMTDPVSGAAISGSILTPGALRSRNRSAVAEPRFEDALATLVAHNKQMRHWMSYYDLAVDMQAIMGNRDVMNSVEAAAGGETVTMLKKWVDAFAQGGTRDAASGLAVTGWAQRIAGRAAVVGLLGRVSTLIVQSTQLAAASVKMPTGAYLSRFSKLMTGNLEWADAVNSEFIQRRIKTAPPIVQQAMKQLGTENRPNRIRRAVSLLGNLLSGADGLFTGGTYAILLDWHRTNAAKMGLEGVEAEAWAHAEAARATEEVAQPVRMANRSMVEITMTSPFAKMGWAYASEARQKLALAAWGASKIKSDPAYAAKTAFLTFIVGGLMSQVLKNLWRDLLGDDDERKWSAERLTKTTLTGPLHGFPLFSSMVDGGNSLSSFKWTPAAIEDLMEGDNETTVDTMRDIDTILSAAGYFNDTAAGVASLSHAGLDFARLLEHLAEEGED